MRSQVIRIVASASLFAVSAFAQNRVIFDNQSGEPALVKLIGPTLAEVNVATGDKAGTDALPGRYHIKVRYGTAGKYRYAKGDEFDVVESATTRSEVSITLHKVAGGDYETHPISADDFSAIRDWTDVKGRTIRASLVDFDGSNVKLQKDGQTYTLPLSRLSARDREYLRERRSITPPRKAQPQETQSADNRSHGENPAFVELRGKKVGFYAPGTMRNGNYLFIMVFRSDERLRTGELYFGYESGEMPDEYAEMNFDKMKGLRGKLGEERTIPFQGSQTQVRMLTSVTPLQ